MSLKDQLLAAGLVSEKQVKKANKKKYQAAKEARNGGKALEEDKAKIAAEQSREAKKAKDQALNAEQKAKAEKKAIAAQIKQLITVNKLPKDADGTAYNFPDGKRIKKIHLSDEFIEQLSKGRLCIVKLGDQYEVVAAPVADKIAERDASRIIVRNDKTATTSEEEDWYADYEIPDDLMW